MRRLPLVLLAAMAWSGPAWADPKDDARRHFVAGLQAAETGAYQLALDEFLAAQNAWPHPNTLYNIAHSYSDLGNLEEAIRYYKLYQSAVPEKAEDVDPVLAVLNARLAERSAPVVPPPVEPPPTVGATSATPEDVARLAQIADELRAIQGRLATAAPVAEPVVAEVPVTPPTSVPEVPKVALIDEAYERVVVTASRYGQSPLDAPSTVTILTGEDLRQSGATNLPEVLRRVAGVDVMELASGQPDVSIRGFNRELSNKVLVLVDGRSVYLDFLGTVLWSTLPTTLEAIDRIEVIRGPGSAVYGANAVSGVVNIITRTPGEGPSLATARIGTDGYVHGSAVADGRHGRTTWRLDAGWDQVARWSDSTPDSETMVPLLDDTTWSQKGAHADGRVDSSFLDSGYVSASGGYAQGTVEFYALGALGDYAMQYDSGWARGDAAYGPVHLRSFYTSLDGRTGPWAEQEGARSLDTDVNSDTIDVELEANGDVTTGAVRHRLNAGVGYRYKAIAWGYLESDDPIVENHYSAFAQEEARIGPVALVASLRADKAPLVPIAETLSPRGAVLVHLGDARTLRVTGGSAFRAPTFLETYFALPLPTETDGVYVEVDGSKDLVPERILTGELGFHDESTAFHTADAALYVNRVTDLISLTDATQAFNPYNPDTNGFEAATTGFINSPDAYTAIGGELDARVFPIDGLDVYANLAIERIVTDDGVVDASVSLVKVNGGAIYRTPWRIDVAAHVQYASDEVWALRDYAADGTLQTTDVPVAGRTIVSARVAGRPFADDKLELAVAGWNLAALGTDGFREHPKGQLVRPRLWGEVTWRF